MHFAEIKKKKKRKNKDVVDNEKYSLPRLPVFEQKGGKEEEGRIRCIEFPIFNRKIKKMRTKRYT